MDRATKNAVDGVPRATWYLVIWTAPNTLLGASIGFLGVLFGGRVQRHGAALEFHGMLVRGVLKYGCGPWVSAITFGHCILGQSAEVLEAVRDHECVHVRQYEKWGPFFIPAYLCSSAVAFMQGKRPYRDNFFEREAYGENDELL